MACRWCADPARKLVNAHIIPEAFFRRASLSGTLNLLSSDETKFRKRAPIDVYDQEILCEVCEPNFGPWDTYAIELLTDPPKDSQEKRNGKEIVAYEVETYSYDLLKLFFVSVLWRAAVSVRPFFDRVKIGPYEQAAKSMLLEGRAGTPEEFSVTVCKLTPPLNQMFLDPHPNRFDGINFCQIYLGTYIAYIKLDKRPTPYPFGGLILEPESRLKVVTRDMRQSRAEMGVVGKIVQSPQNARKWQ